MRRKRDNKYNTIKDVAKEASVSIATVSRVINNGIVKEDKKKRVLEAIKKLNYVPNDSARNLASVSNTKNIYFLVHNLNTNYYLELIKGFKSVLKIYSYNFSLDFYGNGDRDYQEALLESGLSSEFKALVELGKVFEVPNKLIVNWDNDNISYKVSEQYNGLIAYTKDEELFDFLKTKVFQDLKMYEKESDGQKFLTPTLNEAIELFNLGIRGDIYTFDDSTELEKICPNIKTIKFDFFGLGIALSRIAMKTIREEEVTKIEFNIGD